jgi:(E)-4-hydroxy-3-methylbut-2-enyl-diphosphate synthase
VNGIGEASHADFGITGAKNEGLIFAHGKPLRKVPQGALVDALFEEIDKSLHRGSVEVDASKSAEGAAWLRRIEDENADELTPERIAQMEAQAAREEDGDAAADAKRRTGPGGDPAAADAKRRTGPGGDPAAADAKRSTGPGGDPAAADAKRSTRPEHDEDSPVAGRRFTRA